MPLNSSIMQENNVIKMQYCESINIQGHSKSPRGQALDPASS